MARSFTIDIDVPEADLVAERLRDVADRFGRSAPGFERVTDVIEDAHTRFFNRLAGRYVRTGALRASLTQPSANGAIREIHGGGLLFGTSVHYARWLTKRAEDPDAGQVSKSVGKGTSAVLISPKSMERGVARELLEWVMEPVE